jgi:nucleoid-associated protein YgaU
MLKIMQHSLLIAIVCVLIEPALYAQNNDFLDEDAGSGSFGSRSDPASEGIDDSSEGKNNSNNFGGNDLGFGNENENEFDDLPDGDLGDEVEGDNKSNAGGQDLDSTQNSLEINAPASNNENSQFQNQGSSPQNAALSGANSPSSNEENVSSAPNAMFDNFEINATKIEEANEFSGVPPIPGSLRMMADGEAPEEYFVESGDTLFDICSQLLDEGGYWPKLWSLNPQVKNPHFLWPGMKLIFYSGDEDNPPFLEVVAEDDIVPIDKDGLVEEVLLHGNVPDFQRTFGMAETKVVGMDEISAEMSLDGMIIDAGELFRPVNRKFTIPGFIFSEEKIALAVVEAGLEGEFLLANGDSALVEIEETLATGTTYSVLRPIAQINSRRTDDIVGYRYDFVANIKVDKILADSGKAVVSVQNGRLGMQKNDIVVPFVSTKRVVPLEHASANISSAEASIVGFEDYGSSVAGEGYLVFVDKGTSGGVSLGQYFQIYSPSGVLANSAVKDDAQLVKHPVAVIKIVDTTDVASLGMVISNRREVSLGDSLGKG